MGVRYFGDANDFCEEHPEVVIFACSILSLGSVLAALPVQRLRRSTLFVDVLSVKEFPKRLMLAGLPPEVRARLPARPVHAQDQRLTGERLEHTLTCLPGLVLCWSCTRARVDPPHVGDRAATPMCQAVWPGGGHLQHMRGLCVHCSLAAAIPRAPHVCMQHGTGGGHLNEGRGPGGDCKYAVSGAHALTARSHGFPLMARWTSCARTPCLGRTAARPAGRASTSCTSACASARSPSGASARTISSRWIMRAASSKTPLRITVSCVTKLVRRVLEGSHHSPRQMHAQHGLTCGQYLQRADSPAVLAVRRSSSRRRAAPWLK